MPATQPSPATSSPSRNAILSPLASAAPTLRACAAPPGATRDRREAGQSPLEARHYAGYRVVTGVGVVGADHLPRLRHGLPRQRLELLRQEPRPAPNGYDDAQHLPSHPSMTRGPRP